jgi:hypothetical protein
VAARVWPISSGWAPTEIVYLKVNWAAQEVPFPKFGIKLHEDQSADAFMVEIEKRVNVMIGEYTMNEYKAYKALVKHKRRINRVFSEACGDKSFNSRGQLFSHPHQRPPNKVFEARLSIYQRRHFLWGQAIKDEISRIVEA